MTMMGANGMQLNNGKKWKLKPVSIQQMDAVIKKVNDFKSDNIVEYNQLGKAIFNDAKKIMLDDSYTGEKFDQIHLFFYGIEGNMHTLMVIKSTDEAKNQLAELKNKLNEFNTYFE
jgi:hydroxymethylpyrimidine pyrophosphatase-like HAD family hydrolase